MSDTESTDVENDPHGSSGNTADTADTADTVDLDAVERDLDGVETALDRLAEGSYWTDEVTGQPIPEDTLRADPTARRSG